MDARAYNASISHKNYWEDLSDLEVNAKVVNSEKVDHSAYITARTTYSQTYSLFSVFTFTAIVLLLTLLPDPSQTMAQATIFFLTLFFYLCLVNLYGEQSMIDYCIRYAPPIPRSFKKRGNLMSYMTWILLPTVLVLMFLSWNLTYLALATGISGAFAIVLAYLDVIRPLWKVKKEFYAETGKTWRIRKFFDERDGIFKSEDR